MPERDRKVEIKLLGQFRLRGSCGEDCTPRGRKACAVLAMLALSPGNRRSRAWLQEKLWGSRGKEQAAASLRQSLFEIRQALGNDWECIVGDKFNVSLAGELFVTDLDGGCGEGELLEGFDIGEEGFEEWLREQRINGVARSATTRIESRRREGMGVSTACEPPHPQNAMLLVRGVQAAQGEVSILADSLLDSIAKTVTELAAATVLDRRVEPVEPVELHGCSATPGILSLRSDVFESETKRLVRLALLRLPANTLAWSSTLQLPDSEQMDLNDPSVMRCINQIVNVVIDQVAKRQVHESEQAAPSALCYSGILHLFRLGKVNFQAADRLFASAFEIEPRGIYLAWRAYLRTFLLAERQYTCRQTIEEEALDFMHRALESEPHNSYVAGLSAHVQAIMRRSYVAAYELAERSIMLNHANPIGWACLGIAKSYLGKSEEGFNHTMLARTIAGSSPFRYQIDLLSCVAGTIAGELDKAVHLAEASHASAPMFAPPLRYLSALYAHDGRHERSFEMVQKLRMHEPDFCYDKLRDKSYPAAGLHRTPLINSLPKRQI